MKLSRLISKIVKRIPSGHRLYSGHYHSGEADIVYIPDGDRKIFDGDFDFINDMGSGRYVKAWGMFVDDLKNDDWAFESRGRSSLVKLNMQFYRGHITGYVEFCREEAGIENVRQTVLMMQASNNVVTGNLSGRINDGEFKGFCDEQGYPHGEWTLTFSEDGDVRSVKKEVWDHGTMVDAYEERVSHKSSKVKMDVGLRQMVNYLLDNDAARLFSVIRHGSLGPMVHIPCKR